MALRFIVLGLLLNASWLYGQSAIEIKIDSLSQAFTVARSDTARAAIADLLSEAHYLNSDYDSCRYYANYEIEIARELGYDSLLADGYRALCIVESRTGSILEAIRLGDSALHYYETSDNIRGKLVMMNNLSYLASQNGKCDHAVAHAAVADSIQRAITLNDEAIIRTRLIYCTILQDCGFEFLVPELIKEYLPLTVSTGMVNMEASYCMRLIICYRVMMKYDSALVYAERVRNLLPKYQNKSVISAYNTNVARLYRDMGELDQAHELLLSGLSYAKETKQEYGVAHKLVNLGHVTYLKADYASSIDYYNRGLSYFLGNSRYDLEVAEHYGNLADAYAHLNEYQKAYEAWRQSDVILDSLARFNHALSLEEMTVKYETERVQRDLVSSKMELQEQVQRTKKQQRIISLLALSAVLLSLGIWWYFHTRRRRKQLEYDKRQAELRYNLLRAQMNPHFIFNSLNSIQSFFSSQHFRKGNEFLGTFSQLVRRVLEQTGQKLISLAEELDTLTMYLELEKLRLGSVLEFTIHVDKNIETDLIRVPPLIFQPFVENAIWHGIAPKGGPGKIDVFIRYGNSDDILYCTIEDDGVGMNKDKIAVAKHRSCGVEITRERLGARGEITIQNRKLPYHNGVRTELIIPLWD